MRPSRSSLLMVFSSNGGIRLLPLRTIVLSWGSPAVCAGPRRLGPAPRPPPGWQVLQYRAKTVFPRSIPVCGAAEVGAGTGVPLSHAETSRVEGSPDFINSPAAESRIRLLTPRTNDRRSLVMYCNPY